MKTCCLLVGLAGLSLMSPAQTVSGSASTNASVTSQVDTSERANQNAQAGASVYGNASVQGEARTEHRDRDRGRHESESRARGSAVLASGATLNTELVHSLDARSAKAGDQVTARLTEDFKAKGKVVVQKGSRLVGHVTECRARTKENADSRLGIIFDRAVLKSGEEVSFKGAVQAMAPPMNAALSAAGDESSTINASGRSGGGPRRSGGGGGLLGGVTSTVGGVVGGAGDTVGGAVNGTAALAGQLTAEGRLTSVSQGVIGLEGLTLLNSAASGDAQGSVVASTTQNVKLESGTQMLLKVTGSSD